MYKKGELDQVKKRTNIAERNNKWGFSFRPAAAFIGDWINRPRTPKISVFIPVFQIIFNNKNFQLQEKSEIDIDIE